MPRDGMQLTPLSLETRFGTWNWVVAWLSSRTKIARTSTQVPFTACNSTTGGSSRAPLTTPSRYISALRVSSSHLQLTTVCCALPSIAIAVQLWDMDTFECLHTFGSFTGETDFHASTVRQVQFDDVKMVRAALALQPWHLALRSWSSLSSPRCLHQRTARSRSQSFCDTTE